MIRPSRFRELALSFDGAVEAPHMERIAFRTKHRIFATLPPDGATANLLLDAPLQEALCDAQPGVFAPVPGGWGRMGYTTVDLARVTEVDLRRVLAEAFERANVPRKRSAKRR